MGYLIRNPEDGVFFPPEPRGVLHNSLQSLVFNQYLLTPKEAFRSPHWLAKSVKASC